MSDHASNMVLAEIREMLQQGQKDLATAYLARPDFMAYLLGRSRLVDRMLCRLWSNAHMPAGTALIAVGGYGREKLYPHSDIDVLIALNAPPSEALAAKLECLVSQFWDIGKNISSFT